MSRIFLASGSPRRCELLRQLGFDFTQIVPNIREIRELSESAEVYVRRLAEEKAEAACQMTTESGLFLGADTLISYEGQVFEKPNDELEHRSMLMQLSGQTHQVMTGIAVTNGIEIKSEVLITEVEFSKLTLETIQNYWKTKEPQDKAGGYAIQ